MAKGIIKGDCMRLRYGYTARILAVMLSVLVGSAAFAQTTDRFVIAQYDLGLGLKFIHIQGFRSAECTRLISTFEAGLRVDCPNCVRDYAACTSDLGEYTAVWDNQRFVLPYVSSGGLRDIFMGASRQILEDMCDDLASHHRLLGRDAICIW